MMTAAVIVRNQKMDLQPRYWERMPPIRGPKAGLTEEVSMSPEAKVIEKIGTVQGELDFETCLSDL